MSSLELAYKFMSCFFGEEPIETLENILHENLEFEGPLYKFNTSKEYIKSKI